MTPESTGTRRRRNLEKTLSRFLGKGEAVNEEGEIDENMRTSVRGRLRVTECPTSPSDNVAAGSRSRQQHYRLSAIRVSDARSRFFSFIGMNDSHSPSYEETREAESCTCCFGSPELWVRRFFFWAFRSSFTAVFLAAAAGFLILTNMFAVGIFSILQRKRTCIGGLNGDKAYYVDAFGTCSVWHEGRAQLMDFISLFVETHQS
jgi:hypothetical protein